MSQPTVSVQQTMIRTETETHFWTDEGIKLHVDGPGFVDGGVLFETATPFARIGRAAGMDVRLEDPEVSRWHACLFRCAEGLFFFDLGSRTGIVQHGTTVRSGWIVPGEPIVIHPYTLHVESERIGPDVDPLEWVPREVRASCPSCLTFTNRRGKSVHHRIRRVLTVLGTGSTSNLKLVDSAIAKAHLAFFQDGTNLWVVNLAGAGAFMHNRDLNGERLFNNSRLHLGPYQIEVSADCPDGNVAEGSALALSGNGIDQLHTQLVVEQQVHEQSQMPVEFERRLQKARDDAMALEQLLSEMEENQGRKALMLETELTEVRQQRDEAIRQRDELLTRLTAETENFSRRLVAQSEETANLRARLAELREQFLSDRSDLVDEIQQLTHERRELTLQLSRQGAAGVNDPNAVAVGGGSAAKQANAANSPMVPIKPLRFDPFCKPADIVARLPKLDSSDQSTKPFLPDAVVGDASLPLANDAAEYLDVVAIPAASQTAPSLGGAAAADLHLITAEKLYWKAKRIDAARYRPIILGACLVIAGVSVAGFLFWPEICDWCNGVSELLGLDKL